MHHNQMLELRCRERKIQDGEWQEIHTTVQWNPEQTAVIICDMWDDHLCKGAAARVAELAPALNRAVLAARDRGVFIIHAPAGTMAFYEDAPQRRRASDAPFVESPVEIKTNSWNPEREGESISWMRLGGCGCDKPCSGWLENKHGIRRGTGVKTPKTRQIETLDIFAADAISDSGQEIYNLMASHKIDNVIVMGVHTNICVLSRSFGIRQMVYWGKNVVLCRDLTDSIFNPAVAGVNHLQGNEEIVEHIEQYWCPTITSNAFTNEPAFRFDKPI